MCSTNSLLYSISHTPMIFLQLMVDLLISYNLKSHELTFKFHMIARLFQSYILHLIIQVSVNDTIEIQEMYNQWVRRIILISIA